MLDDELNFHFIFCDEYNYARYIFLLCLLCYFHILLLFGLKLEEVDALMSHNFENGQPIVGLFFLFSY